MAGSKIPLKGPNFGIRLDVPLICQTSALSCWYAAAQMVAYYREAGPRQGLPDVLLNDRRLTLPEMDQLAEIEGLSTFLLPNIGRFSAADLYAALQRHGPLWCAGEWGAIENGHVIVLTGVDGNHIYYNDPEPVNVGTKNKAGTVDWFNENLLWRIKNPILYRDA